MSIQTSRISSRIYTTARLSMAATKRKDGANASSHPPSDVKPPSTPPRSQKFERMAAEWWDRGRKVPAAAQVQSGAARLCPRRRRRRISARDPKAGKPFAGLRLLDIGCGGGILSEPMARLGAEVVGIDPSDDEHRGRAAACRAEAASRSTIAPRPPRRWARPGERFDVVLAMEVVEHVADVARLHRRRGRALEAGRPALRRHHQPHAKGLRARDRRRGICAALAAARHARLFEARAPGGTRGGARRGRASRSIDRTASATIRSPTAGRARPTWT